jgi:DNA modification methylase
MIQILQGDCREVLKTLPDCSVHCCVTSPPYFGLRDYGCAGQIGLESTPDAYVAELVAVFREVRRVLRDDGTLWLNLGDSYSGSGKGPAGNLGKTHNEREIKQTSGIVPDGLKPKDLIGIPWRVAFALQADGWYLRQDIIWHKPNPMPESVTDRCTKAHEYIFLLSKSPRYYYDAEAVKEKQTESTVARAAYGWNGRTDDNSNGARTGSTFKRMAESGEKIGTIPADGLRNKRSVWTVSTKPYREAHFATFPPDLIRPCIRAGCPPAGKRCDCDEIISSPTGSGEVYDPSMETGRAGMNRPRRDGEGTRPITKREQRWNAEEMKKSAHIDEMREICGAAFDHYIRTDKSGARPLPESIRKDFLCRGWITDAPPCSHPVEPAGTVLDPFGGSGTTGEVAASEGRKAILIELNPQYVKLAQGRGGLFCASNTAVHRNSPK